MLVLWILIVGNIEVGERWGVVVVGGIVVIVE